MKHYVIKPIDVRSTSSPVHIVDGLQVKYPEAVTAALCTIFQEASAAYKPLIELNKEWEKDYQFTNCNAQPWNLVAQIDMVGLTKAHFTRFELLSHKGLVSELKHLIFEIEPSWAFYGPLAKMFEKTKKGISKPSFYAQKAEELLASVTKKTGRKVVLLAVTEEKYKVMLNVEFGITDGVHPTPDDVKLLTGFDDFWGPQQFLKYYESAERHQSTGKKVTHEYLFNVRSSHPVRKLKNLNEVVEQPLLGDDAIREFIKRYSLTFNIDNPNWDIFSLKNINDTKHYLPTLGMGYLVSSKEDVLRISEFCKYLNNLGTLFRAKPANQSFGCYGHVVGSFSDNVFINELLVLIKTRGPYIIQIEQESSKCIICNDEYHYIDRVFVGFNFVTKQPFWMGGHREFMPRISDEAKNGRLHTNILTVTGEII